MNTKATPNASPDDWISELATTPPQSLDDLCEEELMLQLGWVENQRLWELRYPWEWGVTDPAGYERELDAYEAELVARLGGWRAIV